MTPGTAGESQRQSIRCDRTTPRDLSAVRQRSILPPVIEALAEAGLV